MVSHHTLKKYIYINKTRILLRFLDNWNDLTDNEAKKSTTRDLNE